MGSCKFGVSENNDVTSDVSATTTTTMVVMWNSWKHELRVASTKWIVESASLIGFITIIVRNFSLRDHS